MAILSRRGRPRTSSLAHSATDARRRLAVGGFFDAYPPPGAGGGSAAPGRLLTGPPPVQIAIHETVQVAVEDPLHVAHLDVGAQVLDHLIRLQPVGTDLPAPRRFALITADLIHLCLVLLLSS